MIRLQAAAAVALVVLSGGLLAGACWLQPSIPFIVQDEQAPWIMYPSPPTGWLGVAPRHDPPVQIFTRRLELPAAPAGPVRLYVRALRGFRVRVNGREIAPDAEKRHWRRFRELEATGAFRAGRNEVRVEVWNPLGPPLLSLRAEGLGAALASDGRWLVRPPDEPEARAIPVGVERIDPTTFALERPAEAMGRRAPLLAALFGLGCALSWLAVRRVDARSLARALPWTLVAVWTALFAATVHRIPADVGFDAHHHVAYVDFLREQGRLPLATDGWMMFHPPLYYAATALLVEAGEALAPRSLATWKLVGWGSGLATALLTLALARRLFGAARPEALAAGLFAGLLPMNLYISAYVTNESLHAALATATAWATVSLMREPRPSRRSLGVWTVCAALALLTKYTAVLVVGVSGLFLLLSWARVERATPRSVAGRGLGLGLGLGALAGWFYARQWIHFGTPFPLNVGLPGQLQDWWSPPGYATPAFFWHFGQVLDHPFLAGTHTAWDSLYATLWGDGQLAGQLQRAARHGFWDWELMAAGYWLAVPASLLIGLGAASGLRRALGSGDPALRAGLSYLLTLGWLLVLAVLYMTLRQPDYGQAKAFYALALVAPLAVCFGLGVGAADAWLAARGRWPRTLLHGWLTAFAGATWLVYAG